MLIKVENRTPYLNDYHFQTLCLLYFPGEKFPPDISEAHSEARFFLEEREADGVKRVYASVKLKAGEKTASAEKCFSADDFSFPQDLSFAAQAAAGCAFLEAGFALFGFLPPWGYLTGLRPVKRARFYLDKGFTEGEVRRLFVEDYKVSAEKTELSIETARAESRVLSACTGKDCCLYVAVPFCPTRCSYCSFVSYSNEKLFRTLPDYLDRLDEDLAATAAVIKSLGLRLKSIYIGGGTPSVLSETQLERLFCRLDSDFDLSELREFSFESGRPDTTTGEKLLLAKRWGVDRVSVNPQSTDDAVLRRIGRGHSVKQFYEAAETALAAGFKSVNADLIAGLPGDSFDGFCKSLEDVIALGFGNITVHTLAVKNASPIRFGEAGIYDAEGAAARKCVAFARERLRRAGLFPYYLYRQKNTVGNAENVGYSVIGAECAYNVLMMEETNTVFACGASAISKLVSADGRTIERIAFPKYPFEYLASPRGIGEKKIYEFFGKQGI